MLSATRATSWGSVIVPPLITPALGYGVQLWKNTLFIRARSPKFTTPS